MSNLRGYSFELLPKFVKEFKDKSKRKPQIDSLAIQYALAEIGKMSESEKAHLRIAKDVKSLKVRTKRFVDDLRNGRDNQPVCLELFDYIIKPSITNLIYTVAGLSRLITDVVFDEQSITESRWNRDKIDILQTCKERQPKAIKNHENACKAAMRKRTNRKACRLELSDFENSVFEKIFACYPSEKKDKDKAVCAFKKAIASNETTVEEIWKSFQFATVVWTETEKYKRRRDYIPSLENWLTYGRKEDYSKFLSSREQSNLANDILPNLDFPDIHEFIKKSDEGNLGECDLSRTDDTDDGM